MISAKRCLITVPQYNPAITAHELSLKFVDGVDREDGILLGCLTPLRLNQRIDISCFAMFCTLQYALHLNSSVLMQLFSLDQTGTVLPRQLVNFVSATDGIHLFYAN